MSPLIDYTLVLLAIALALSYLIWRKVSASRRAARDWSSGHAEICDACPVITIQKARWQRASQQNR